MKCRKFLAGAAFFSLMLNGISAFDIKPASISINSEPITSPGLALVTIRADQNGTRIVVDNGTSGYSSWTGSLLPGQHIISASAPDHYPEQFPFFVQANMKYTIAISLEPHTGFLSIEVYPPDAAVYVDGSRVLQRLEEIPVGRHSVVVKKFGFDENKVPILILREKTTTLNVTLSPSVFEIGAWRVSPRTFNPANGGVYNRARLSFSVTAPGYGRIEILDEKGRVLRKDDLPVFRTWSQAYAWRGTDDAGLVLADGEYQLGLTLWPLRQDEGMSIPTSDSAPSRETPRDAAPAIAVSTKVRIDSILKIVPSGSSAARPGLLYFPDPKVRSLLPGSAELVGGYPSGGSLSLGFRIGDSTMLAVEGVYDAAAGDGGVAGGVLESLGRLAGLDAALFGRIAWSGAAAPAYPGSASEAELALPFALDLGSLRMGISPGIAYDLRNNAITARAGAGVWYESPRLVAGFSAQGGLGASPFMSAGNPLYLAAEARLLFPRLPITLLARLSGALTPGLASPAASFGFGAAW